MAISPVLSKRSIRMATALLIASLVLGACSHGQFVAVGQGGQTRIEPDPVLALAFERISDRFLEPVDLRRVGLSGLAGLTAVDRQLSLSVEEPNFGFRRGDEEEPFVVFPMPGPRDSLGWAATITAAIEVVRDRSTQLSAIDDEVLYNAVIDGFVSELDAYSRYHSAAEARYHREQRDGYGGVGLELRRTGDGVVIAGVMPGSPADRIGIGEGDQLQSVDGFLTSQFSLDQLSAILHGPIGSSVEITTQPATPRDAERAFRLRRERIVERTIYSEWKADVAFITIKRFNGATAEALATEVRKLRSVRPSMRGLVLDLRGNPGGLLDQAVRIADLFLAKGSTILDTRGRHPASHQHYEAKQGDISGGLPLVVLVDGGSASSSEIVASALKDNERALVLGGRSLGKGSVQSVTRLPNDGELLLTWSLMHGPSGRTFHGRGVIPHICTNTSNDGVAEVAESEKPIAVVRPLENEKPPCERTIEHDNGGHRKLALSLLSDPSRLARLIEGPDRSVAEAY